MGDLENLIGSAMKKMGEGFMKQKKSSEGKEGEEKSEAKDEADNPMNTAYHVVGEFVDKMKGYIVKDPADSKYQMARELVSVVKSNKEKLSDTILLEVGAIVAYKGINYGLDRLKKYFGDK